MRVHNKGNESKAPPILPHVDQHSSRASMATLKRSHWKKLERVVFCLDCKRKVTGKWRDKGRNCCMCGEVFCRKCTCYRRKLSSNAEPDPCGTFRTVCKACFNVTEGIGCFVDHRQHFQYYRRMKKEIVLSRRASEETLPINVRQRSESKTIAVREQAERLAECFHDNCSKVSFMMSVKTPEWHKSSHWQESESATNCAGCNSRMRKLIHRKIHCRVCSQVFCTTCTRDEIILYLSEEGAAKWALNGKGPGPSRAPTKYELLPVCKGCSEELMEIVMKHATLSDLIPKDEDLLKSLVQMQSGLNKMQRKVEERLPNYQKIVDSLDIGGSSPQSIEASNPLKQLAKSQADLSDLLSKLAVESQKLKSLRPTPETALEKLVKSVMLATYQFYSENMYLFRTSNSRLAEFMPMESLNEIQDFVNLQSMDRIHIILQQIMYEGLYYQNNYAFSESTFQPIITALTECESEFKQLMDRMEVSWEEHCKCVREFIASEMKSKNRRIKLHIDVPKHHPQASPFVRYAVVSYSSSLINECLRELEAKTTEKDFPKTKEGLSNAGVELESLLCLLKAAYSSTKNSISSTA